MISAQLLQNLAIALTLGLLIGVERGWQEREAAEGSRIAGIRTFGLIAVLGALWALLAEELGVVLLGVAFLGLVAVMVAAYVQDVRVKGDHGITTLVAALITFALGAATMQGYQVEAAAVAVLTATVLGLKPILHGWLRRLEQQELFAAMRLLLISVVVLPVLPNQGYGPWQALNPFEIWWMVVLIAGISFVGYFAIKILGAKRGIVLTALSGGLVSSTAVTLNFSRLAGTQPQLQRLLAIGVVVASTTMFPRMVLEVAVVNPGLVPFVAPPLIIMTVAAGLVVWWLWRQETRRPTVPEPPVSNPLELLTALKFGLFLTAIVLLAHAGHAWFGDIGVYAVAGFSGLSDVDAITLSLARMARNELEAEVAARAIVIAGMVNTAVKGGITLLVAGGLLAKQVIAVMLIVLLVGAGALVLL